MPDVPGSILVTDFSRGWDPTHPDEQLVGAAGAPGAQFGAAVGAPFKSPDLHDVDFWNGYLNKRQEEESFGPTISSPGAVGIIGLFVFFFTTIIGTPTSILMAVCNQALVFFNGSTWVALLGINIDNTSNYIFSILKNLVFVSAYKANPTLNLPVWWDGVSTTCGKHGMRMSPFYRGLGHGTLAACVAHPITGLIVTMDPSQPASGLFRGKQVWLQGGIGGGALEPAFIANFATTGTPGTNNYFVTQVTLQSLPRYLGGSFVSYTGIYWNGGTIGSSGSGASITTTGAATCLRILAVTNLASGGQRSSEWSVDVPNGTTGIINLSDIDMAYGDGTLFGTDINSNATTWYMTLPFDPQLVPANSASGPSQVFYLIPDNKGVATDTSTGFNPMPNSTTGFSIKTGRSVTDTTLIANTAADAQGYFTGQVDAPYYQFSVAWQDFLVCSGDPWNPSSIWITAFGAPQVFGTQGGLDGSLIEIPNGNDGQVIVALYVWRGDCYIFKTNSVYVLQFNGNTSLSPFNVTKLQGNFGAISPRCIIETDNYLVFLSPSGPCAITGLTVALLPEAEDIRAKFIGPDAWNLSLMNASQAISIPAKKQAWFQAATATAGDTVLVYDWQRRTFLYHTGSIQKSTLFQDLSISPPVTYGGDVLGQVWKMDLDDSAQIALSIDFLYSTPWTNLGDPAAWKTLQWIFIGGVQQETGILNITLEMDFGLKPAVQYSMDMSDPQFQRGLYVPVGQRAKYFKVTLTNNTSGIPVAIRFMRLDFVNQGTQL